MIYLTCDVHHMSLKTGNQQHCELTETYIATMFSLMLKQQKMKATFFITGKCFEEEWPQLQTMCNNKRIEIGGHTYHCFTPELWHRGWNKLVGNYNGPKWQQNWDIQKTKRIILRRSGRLINSWRNHMYMHGPYTEELLLQNGIHICCDGVKRASTGIIKHPTGMANYPLNIIPDHEHLYHAERTEEWVENWIKRYNWSDDYGSHSYYFDQWFEIFKHEVEIRELKNVSSHILIHPITLYLCDGFSALEKVTEFLSNYDTGCVSELLKFKQKPQMRIIKNKFKGGQYE